MNKPEIELIKKLAGLKIKNNNRLDKIKRVFANKNKTGMLSNAQIFALYNQLVKEKKIKTNPGLAELLKKRKIRTLSGVAPIAVLTKPYPCPGHCAFCPGEKGMPKSYLSNEPAVMRAILTKFDPWEQVTARLRALSENGHDTNKIELIVMGGTWSYLPKQYQSWFIKRCFEACNNKKSPSISLAQKFNEKAKHRIVALTLETRPDYISKNEIKYWRTLGATKIELGVQIADDAILKKNHRGHGTNAIIRATKICREAGFKIAYHLMPNLPGATIQKDLFSFKKLFSDENYQPDFIKIYPTVVTNNALIFKWWQKGLYHPYSDADLFELLINMKLRIPEYVRIIRLIRDIPKESIEAGNQTSNLRELLQTELKKRGQSCQCLRCRECREQISDINKIKLFKTFYKANGGQEIFLQFASKDKQKLFAFLRLRLPDKKEKNFIKEIQDCAMIREIHTYGQLMPFGKSKKSGIQHLGLGKLLMTEAENMAKENGFKKMAVISGVGVRDYYRKLGYKLVGTYLVKKL